VRPDKLEVTVSRKGKATTHDRRRRAEWARRIAADQRRAAQRSATTLQSIARQIRSIQTGGRTRLQSVGPLQVAVW
jgi:hypothetical protein